MVLNIRRGFWLSNRFHTADKHFVHTELGFQTPLSNPRFHTGVCHQTSFVVVGLVLDGGAQVAVESKI